MPRAKKSALTVQKPFPVLRLPPEIRISIWRYAVVKEGSIFTHKTARKKLASKIRASRLRSGRELRLHWEDDQRRVASKLAVAFTCRQIYLEVTPIYYRENTFHFGGDQKVDVKRFADTIGPDKAASILSVSLCNLYGPLNGYLSHFSGLERLEVSDVYFGVFTPMGISEVISYIQEHPSTTVKYNGKVWGLSKLISLAEKNGDVGDW